MPSTPSSPTPDLERSTLSGLIAGCAGLVAIAGLVVFGRLAAPVGLWTALAVAVATAVGIMAFRGGQRAAGRVAAPLAAGETPALPFSGLVDALPDPILVVSAFEPEDLIGRRYIYANRAARELFRIDNDQGLLVSIVRDPAVLEVVDEALFGGIASECVQEIAGAQTRVLRAIGRPLATGLDNARRAILTFRDETELRRVERTRVDFLANASHELRTPLASLTGFIETLRGHARDDPEARDRFLGIMQAQAERMRRLIDDLLSLSRIELNEHVAPSDAVDLSLTIADVVDSISPIAAARGVRIAVGVPSDGSAVVTGDRDQLIQVIQNLVDNALKYSPDKGEIGVKLTVGLTSAQVLAGERTDVGRLPLLTPDHVTGSYAVLRVSDQGKGIAREHLPRLTERFYRVEGQKSGERAGTGLGLAIVKHIANRHRGGLIVESAPDAGSTFVVYLPLRATGNLSGVAKAS